MFINNTGGTGETLSKTHLIPPHGITNCVSAEGSLAYMLWMHQLTHVWASLGARESILFIQIYSLLLCATKGVVISWLKTVMTFLNFLT